MRCPLPWSQLPSPCGAQTAPPRRAGPALCAPASRRGAPASVYQHLPERLAPKFHALLRRFAVERGGGEWHDATVGVAVPSGRHLIGCSPPMELRCQAFLRRGLPGRSLLE